MPDAGSIVRERFHRTGASCGSSAWKWVSPATSKRPFDRVLRSSKVWVERVDRFLTSSDFAAAGERMYRLAAELYPICRSITGDGFRHTLRRLCEQVPLEIHE